MEISREFCERMEKEIAKMYPKKWSEMYFDEWQKALKQDRKYKYQHILLKICNEQIEENLQMQKKYLREREEIITRHKITIIKLRQEYQQEIEEKDKEIKRLKNKIKKLNKGE